MPGPTGLTRPPQGATVAVAFSGGRDSLALLHATCRSAQALGLQVLALHVHHGLLPEADAWLESARLLCADWAARGWPLTLRCARLSGQPGPGESLEAWAREHRHAALARMAREGDASLLLLAQHRRDQAETVLLQALRGAGPAGLAAMPRQIERDGLCWARPWLEQPRGSIEAYLAHHRLQPVDDPSNADLRLARGRLRQQVWPALTAAFADAEVALARVARRAQEADAALAELAALDLQDCADDAGLRLADWLSLSPARRANALRAWWRVHTAQRAPDSLVQRLLAELPPHHLDRRAGTWQQGPWCLRLYRGRLRPPMATVPRQSGQSGQAQPAAAGLVTGGAAARATPGGPAALLGVEPGPVLVEAVLARLRGAAAGAPTAGPLPPLAGSWPLPGWPGRLAVGPAWQHGVGTERLQRLQARARQGGERYALAPRGLPRSLKKQYQARGVPEAQRQGPLLWDGDQLVWAPGLGVDARCWEAEGSAQWQLHWEPAG